MFHQWRIVFERSNGAAIVHDTDGKDDDAETVIPEHGWRSCYVAGDCKYDGSLRVTGKLHRIHKIKLGQISIYFSWR